MSDILFKTPEAVFSYRVAGICVRDEKVLLQKPTNDTAYAFPGGHVAFGETNAETLVREFMEETGATVNVGQLKWVEENFFPWGDKPCHQICLYYMVELVTDGVLSKNCAIGTESIEGRDFALEFHWVPVSELDTIKVYPTGTPELMKKLCEDVQHFVNKEC